MARPDDYPPAVYDAADSGPGWLPAVWLLVLVFAAVMGLAVVGGFVSAAHGDPLGVVWVHTAGALLATAYVAARAIQFAARR